MNAHPFVPTPDEAIAATRGWIERAVIGLDLCPFARAVYATGRIRYVVSEAETFAALVDDLERELRLLVEASPEDVNTTLLIHPRVLTDFFEANDFLDTVDATVERLGLAGVLQVASFHPQYQFAGTAPDDVTNYTNRSPYPTLHLLREASVDEAVAAFPDTKTIYERNIETMRRLGVVGWAALRHTDRLILRELRDSDVDPLYAIQGNRRHMRFTSWAESRDACETSLRRYASSRDANGFAPWTVVHRGDERVIGWGGLNVDPTAPEWGIEVSYFIHPSYEGRGFATEVVRASLEYGFGDLALPRIGAFARPENRASIRVLEKCGFAFLRYEPALERNHYEVHRADWIRTS